MKKILIIFMIILICWAISAEEIYKKGNYYYEITTETISDIASFEILTRNGNIYIDKWSKDFIEIECIKRSKNEYELKDADISITQNGTKAVFESIFKKAIIKDLSIDFNLKIPNSVTVKFAGTKNGNVSINYSNGDTKVITSNGNIHASHIQGAMTAETSNGNIDIDAESIKSLSSSNGNLNINIEKIDADTKIKTNNGNIHLFIEQMPNISAHIETEKGSVLTEGFEPEYSFNSKSKQIFSIKNGKYSLKIFSKVGNIILSTE